MTTSNFIIKDCTYLNFDYINISFHKQLILEKGKLAKSQNLQILLRKKSNSNLN